MDSGRFLWIPVHSGGFPWGGLRWLPKDSDGLRLIHSGRFWWIPVVPFPRIRFRWIPVDSCAFRLIPMDSCWFRWIPFVSFRWIPVGSISRRIPYGKIHATCISTCSCTGGRTAKGLSFVHGAMSMIKDWINGIGESSYVFFFATITRPSLPHPLAAQGGLHS